ncbi:MAG: hypothetical protein AAF656_03100 [Planctomycetota bacterium]
MTTGDFRQLFRNEPFRAFRLTMSSGDTVEVRHPECASMAKTSILISEVGPDGELTERHNYYSLLHVTKIEFLDQPEAAATE